MHRSTKCKGVDTAGQRLCRRYPELQSLTVSILGTNSFYSAKKEILKGFSSFEKDSIFVRKMLKMNQWDNKKHPRGFRLVLMVRCFYHLPRRR